MSPKRAFLKKKKTAAAFTFTRYVHAEVDAVDRVHIEGAGRHEHGRVPLGAFTPRRVRRLVLPAEVGFSLHDSPPQLGAICTPASQHLHTQRFDSITNDYLSVFTYQGINSINPKMCILTLPSSALARLMHGSLKKSAPILCCGPFLVKYQLVSVSILWSLELH